MSSPWIRAADVAAGQFGLMTAAGLRECGVSAGSIANALRGGRLVRIHRGVFSLGPMSTDPRAGPFAAVLASGDDAALSDRAAASHQRLLPVWRGPIDVTTATEGGRARPGIRIHRRSLQPIELVVFDAIPCTTPSRTILDVCGISAALGERAIKQAGARGLLDLAELHRLIDVNRGCRGVARLRMLIDGYRPVPVFTRSEFERLVYELCEGTGLPLPDMNVEVWAAGTLYECDCVWPAERLIVECDSRWHDNPIAARADAERDQALTLAGWRVHRIRWAQLQESPARVAATIGRLLADQRLLLSHTAERRFVTNY